MNKAGAPFDLCASTSSLLILSLYEINVKARGNIEPVRCHTHMKSVSLFYFMVTTGEQ
jgi:hypothetical protein